MTLQELHTDSQHVLTWLFPKLKKLMRKHSNKLLNGFRKPWQIRVGFIHWHLPLFLHMVQFFFGGFDRRNRIYFYKCTS